MQLPHWYGSLLRRPSLLLPQKHCRGICRVDHWESNCKRELATTSTQILADLVPLSSDQVPITTSGFVHLQSQDTGIVWPGNLVGCRSDSGPQTMNLAGPGAWSVPAQTGSYFIASPITKCSSQLCPTWKPGQNI